MLALDNVCLNYDGKPVINGVSFEGFDGELVCLLGASGCGKTSTLRLIAGLEKPDRGSISINGACVSSVESVVAPHKRDVGFLFQDFALFPHLTVAENIGYGLAHLDREAARSRVRELLAQIRLSDHAHKYPHMLSGGEQQRVALARARAPRPRLLLLDEPFSGLDTTLRQRLREETLQVLKNRGVTTIMVTHDPEEAMMMSDRIVLMHEGRVIQTGTPSEIYRNPANAFAARFFGEINELSGTVQGGKIKTGLGDFKNCGFDEGATVDVMIRPDAFRIIASADTDTSYDGLHVCGVRDAGNASMVRLGIGGWPEPHSHIHVRHRGPENFIPGEKIGVAVEPDQVFIFKD